MLSPDLYPEHYMFLLAVSKDSCAGPLAPRARLFKTAPSAMRRPAIIPSTLIPSGAKWLTPAPPPPSSPTGTTFPATLSSRCFAPFPGRKLATHRLEGSVTQLVEISAPMLRKGEERFSFFILDVFSARGFRSRLGSMLFRIEKGTVVGMLKKSNSQPGAERDTR
jgi:hypothetical protein